MCIKVIVHTLLSVSIALVIFVMKVQDDLRHLKEQITGSSKEPIDIEALESAIERTEQSVKVSG